MLPPVQVLNRQWTRMDAKNFCSRPLAFIRGCPFWSEAPPRWDYTSAGYQESCSTFELITAQYETTPVAGAPVISNPPLSQCIPPGGSAVFSVATTGIPPFQYQWFQDGIALPALTNASVSFAGIQPQHMSASYSVVVIERQVHSRPTFGMSTRRAL